ncbi:MAG: PAS domain-containing protein [Myxacorys chilensis ATA2-1-KO14]|jgi:PAS domain S-box-containing protein|nr:PAS domain-containing protein [Myxacorys chilensis ATA2-1-KO14]
MFTVFHSNLGNLTVNSREHCYLWEPGLVWLHALSDGLTALACFSIFLALLYFVRQRRDLPYSSILQLFGVLMVTWGLTHAVEIWALWHPLYWVSGALKSVTAAISLMTASVLISAIPQALTLPSRRQLKAAKVELEISEHKCIEAERKANEAALAESQQRYQALVENSPDIIERFDLQLRHLYVSPVLTEITGVSTEVFLGKTCRDLGMNEVMITTWEAAATALLKTGQKQVIEFTVPTLKGLRSFEMAIAPELSNQQTMESILCISRDITDRKAAETALREQEQRVESILSSVKGIVWSRHAKTSELLYLSPTVEEIYGRSVSEFLANSNLWFEMIHPYDQAVVTAGMDERQQTGSTTLEYRIIAADGQIRWLQDQSQLIYDTNGEPCRIDGVATEITALKATQESLRVSEERLRLALKATNQGLYDLNLQTGEAIVNPEYATMLGYNPATFEETNAKWIERLHPDDGETVANTYRAYVKGEISDYAVEFRQRMCNGNWKWILSLGKIVAWDEAGNPLRMLGTHTDITERKKAEAARLQAEKLRLEFTLLETILDISLAGYWDWDIPNHREYMSPGLKRMFGYEDHELPNVPETWQSLIFAEDLPGVLECFDRHVQSRGEVPYYNEVRYRHKNGSMIWVICVGQVIDWDAAGQPLRMIGCHVDITKLKQTEAQLQKSDAHLKSAQRIGNLGSWEMDLSTEKVTWSDQVFRIFGRDASAGAPSFEEVQQLFHPDDRDVHQQTVETAIATAQPYELECRAYRPDGTLVHVQAKGEPSLNAAGQVRQLTGTVLDITERKQAEAALRQSEATNRALISAIPDLLIWIDQDGTYLDALGSGKSIKLLKPLPELIGVNIYDVLPYERAKERMHYLEQALHTQELQVYEYQLDVEGEIRDEEARLVMCRERQVLCMVRDITDRKQAEEQLLQTTAQLEASNRELEAFAYSVSHDLRSPLRAIDGFSKALLEDYEELIDDEGKDYFDRIRRNVQRMGMLIDDLLRLSRVSRSEMRYTTVNLSALVQEQVEELKASEPERQVECTIAPDAIVYADLTLMRVVISNLLQNAWKFTSYHSSAQIEFGILKQDGQSVYFVRDDGAGFDMTYSSMLFGVFQRLHNTDEFPGTGIGLATVQRSIHRHGGQVWAEAAVEQGATIYFTIPTPSIRTRA